MAGLMKYMNKSSNMPPKMMGVMQRKLAMMKKSKPMMQGMQGTNTPMPKEGGLMGAIKRKLSKSSK